MANAEHIEILSKGSAIWNYWRLTNPEIKPDLSYADLSYTDLKNVNLSKANLDRANLSEAELDGSNLRHSHLGLANLAGADLTEANLHSANLSGANLSFTELSNADLTSANLERADLRRAYLINTDFQGANLSSVNFSEAELNRTNFSEATFNRTKLSDIDLSSVQGLESVTHEGPSSIGIDTVFSSHGKIPEVFLRGCGVPEEFITYIPSFTNEPLEYYSCFISYSHADKAFARQLHDFLQGRGIRCWLDEHQLLPGQDIFEEVDRGIKLWDKVLLCASQHSLSSWWVDNEINRAFKKEQSVMRARGMKVLALIPLDLDGFIFQKWENGKAEQVKARLAGDFIGWESDNRKMRNELERIIKALRTDGGRETPPKSLL